MLSNCQICGTKANLDRGLCPSCCARTVIAAPADKITVREAARARYREDKARERGETPAETVSPEQRAERMAEQAAEARATGDRVVGFDSYGNVNYRSDCGIPGWGEQGSLGRRR